MHIINFEIYSHRSIPHASNMRMQSNVLEDQVHLKRNFTIPNGFQHGSASRDHIHFDETMIAVNKIFQSNIDSFSIIQMCHIGQESYPRIHVMRHSEGPVCRRCKSERGAHSFFGYNNMDPREKPHVFRVLTQAEEILIAHVNPIFKATYARGGKYKYSGHIIRFPQDISTIVQSLPWHVEDIDFIIVRIHDA